jgi:hypothetical protein
MNKKSDIQKSIDEALESIVNIQKAMPKAFFFTRLQARMMKNEGNGWDRVSRFITRPVFAAATMSLVLLLNAYVIIHGVSAQDNQGALTEITSTDDLGATTFYDIENAQP